MAAALEHEQAILCSSNEAKQIKSLSEFALYPLFPNSLIFKAGVTNIVTALDDVPVGEVWTLNELQHLRSIIEEEGGLSWTIVEVLPVHEAIKSGKPKALREK